MLHIITNRSNKISDVVFSQTAMSQDRTFPTSEIQFDKRGPHYYFSIGHHSDRNITEKSVNNTYLI